MENAGILKESKYLAIFSAIFFLILFVSQNLFLDFFISLLATVVLNKENYKKVVLVLSAVFIVLFTLYNFTSVGFLKIIFLHLFFLTASFYFYKPEEIYLNKKINLKLLVLFVFSIFVFLIGYKAILNLFDLNDLHNVKKIAINFPIYYRLFAVFIVPFSEEIFFRGLLLKKLGVVKSSLVFGMFHFFYNSNAEILSAFILGFIFSLIVSKTKNLYYSVFLHFLINFMALMILTF